MARIIFFAALLVHFANVYFLNKNFPAFTPVPGTDQYYYEQASGAIAAGDVLGRTLGKYKAPAYPYFAASVRKLAGGANLPLAIGVVQSVIFSLNAVLVFLIARRLFGYACGILAAVVMVFYGPLIFYDAVMLRDSPVVFLDLGMVYFLMRAAEEKPERASLFLAGVFAGLSFLTKETAVIFVVLAAVWLYFRIGRKMFVFAGVFAAFVFIGLLRSSVASNNTGAFAERSGEMVFYCWNAPESFGHHWACPPAAIREYEQIKNGGLPAVISGILRKMARQPLDYLKLYIRKICAFWWDYEIPNNLNFQLAKDYSPVLRLAMFSFAIIGPLGLIGAFFASGREDNVLLLYIYLGYSLITALLFTAVDRYRLPAVPALTVFAAYAAVETVKMLARVKKPADAAVPASVVAAFILLVFLFRSPVKQRIRINDYMMAAGACEIRGSRSIPPRGGMESSPAPGRGNPQKALEYYRLAAACPPDDYLMRLDDGLNSGYRDFYYSMKGKALYCIQKNGDASN